MSALSLKVRPGEVPTPPWPMNGYTADVYRMLGPLTYPDPDNGYALAALVDALTTVSSWIYDAAHPRPGSGESPWSAVVDPWRCPWWALRWCGQIYGLRLKPALGAWVRPDEVTERRWRQAISDRLGWHRGHPDSIIAAAMPFMRGDKRVVLRERYDPALGESVDAPYNLQVKARASDVLPGELVTIPGRINRLRNPSFEVSASDWQARSDAGNAPTIARSADWSARGASSLKVSATTPGPGARVESAQVTGILPSTTYTLIVTTYTTVNIAAQPLPRVIEFSGARRSLTTAGTQALTVGARTWSWTFATPADVASAVVVTLYPSGGSSPIYYDAISLAEGTSTVYGDGDSPGWTWSGTAHASTSRAPTTYDAPNLRRAVLDAIPIGLLADVVVSDSQTYDDLTGTYDDLPGTYPSYDAMES